MNQRVLPTELPLVEDFDIRPYLHHPEPVYIRALIQPEQAAEWLALYNTHNRKFSETHAIKLACDLLEQLWIYNAEPIRFTREGKIADGQHRLWASTESQKPLDVLLVFGLDPRVLYVTDINMVRTAGAIAHIDGIPNSNQCCAVGSLLHVYQHYGLERIFEPRLRPTKPKVLELLKSKPDLIEFVSGHCSKGIRAVSAPPALTIFCYYIFSGQDKSRADEFFEKLATGVNLDKGNPVYQLRTRLELNAKSKAKLDAKNILALIVKSWVAFRDGKPVYALRWRSEGAAAEEFPTI